MPTTATGVVALFVCIIGYCGIFKLNKKMLFIYSLFLFVLSVAQFAASAAILSSTFDTLQNVEQPVKGGEFCAGGPTAVK